MKSYEEIRNRKADFMVEYHLLSQTEGGRRVTYQHLRCDFMYEGDDFLRESLYMIHPEFIHCDGSLVRENEEVQLDGRATMWIAVDESREKIHRHRIKVGVRGYFMEGSKKIGTVKVIDILSLND